MKRNFERLYYAFCILLWVCIIGNTAVAEPAAPQDIQRFISSDSALRLVQMSTRLRALGVADAHKINEFLTRTNSKTVLTVTFGKKGDKATDKVLWSYFFRNTQIYYGNLKNSHPIVGYYNPLIDFWLLTIWDNSEPNPVLIKTAVTPGSVFHIDEFITSPDIGEIPAWVVALPYKELVKSLPFFSQNGVEGFERKYPVTGESEPYLPSLHTSQKDVRKALGKRLAAFFSSILEFQGNEILNRTYIATLEAVRKSDVRALRTLSGGSTQMPIEAIVKFPELLRTELEPVFYLQGEDFQVVLSSHQRDGRWYLVTAFSNEANRGGKLKLEGIAFIDVLGDPFKPGKR